MRISVIFQEQPDEGARLAASFRLPPALLTSWGGCVCKQPSPPGGKKRWNPGGTYLHLSPRVKSLQQTVVEVRLRQQLCVRGLGRVGVRMPAASAGPRASAGLREEQREPEDV